LKQWDFAKFESQLLRSFSTLATEVESSSTEVVNSVTHYIALIHKDADSCYGVSFPDVPGVITAGDTLDEAIAQAAEVLAFAAEDWQELTGNPFPSPRTLDDLRKEAAFQSDCADAVVAAIPFGAGALRPAAE
jgi:antitoxin HicB